MVTLEICPSPSLLKYYVGDKTKPTIIIVDVFRASTTICAAMQSGVKSISTVATVKKAKKMKEKGFSVVAERNARRCKFADYGNSPHDFLGKELSHIEELIFTTTNCTQAVKKAIHFSDNILIGTFSNIHALIEYCENYANDIIVLCSGWNQKICVEDLIFAGAFAEKISSNTSSDSVKIAIELWENNKTEINLYISQTEHYLRLKKLGLEDDISFCLQPNTTQIVPKYDGKNNMFFRVEK